VCKWGVVEWNNGRDGGWVWEEKGEEIRHWDSGMGFSFL
jgi:hypothetical protein